MTNEMAVGLISRKSTFYYQCFDLLIYYHPIQAAALAASDTNINRQNRSIKGRISGRYFLSLSLLSFDRRLSINKERCAFPSLSYSFLLGWTTMPAA
jgi:hypothetical protein